VIPANLTFKNKEQTAFVRPQTDLRLSQAKFVLPAKKAAASVQAIYWIVLEPLVDQDTQTFPIANA
jgi:hypothetical protein